MNPRLAVISLVALLFGTSIPGCMPAGPVKAPALEPVTISGETFRLEVSADPASREQGLMHRTEITRDGGMLFIFPDADIRSFWMAYCDVDMDLMFLDTRGRVTALHSMKKIPPKGEDESTAAYENRAHGASYWSHYPAQFAIELQAGSLDRLNLAIEDRIELDLPRLKAMAR